MSKVK